MLDPIVQRRQNVETSTFLVTGATGFIGSHLVRKLLLSNHRVIALGRNPIRLPIDHPLLEFRYFDSLKSSRIKLAPAIDKVYHVAAHSTPWGKREIFQKVNVDWTKQIVEAALEAKIKRFVYVSSTAIQFDFVDRESIRETDPLPNRFACEYARSKAEAEAIVSHAVLSGLQAITIRARAVFGNGDRTLLPRLMAAAKRRRLPILGNGLNRIDLTYIDNLIHALVLAADHGKIGSIYTITNDDPILIWDLVQQLSNSLRYKTPLIRRIPIGISDPLAMISELVHKLIPHLGEPPLTRYTAGLLSRTQTFDISAAKTELNYRPSIPMADAVRLTLQSLGKNEDEPSPQDISLCFYTTGYTTAPSRAVSTEGSRHLIRLHAPFGLLRHPKFGITLIDTGYTPRFYEATKKLPEKLYRLVTPVVTNTTVTALSWIRRLCIDPNEVKRIIITHFHADHVGGLFDFPNAEIVSSQSAWNCARNSTGIIGLMRAILPGHIPKDLDQRGRFIDRFEGPGFGPIGNTHDLFEDGSVRLFELPGHATGQLGLLLQTGKETRVLHAADAAWCSKTILKNQNLTWPFLVFAASSKQAIRSKNLLFQVTQKYPDIELVTSHCPELARRWNFDAQLLSCTSEESVP